MPSFNPYSKNILKTNIFNNIKSFYDFEKRIEKIKSIGNRGVEGTKGDIFEIFIEALLSVNKKYLKEKVYPSFRTPSNIKHKLGLSLKKSEMGFDGVYLSRNNVSTYQVKYRNKDSGSLTWKELSTFIGVSEKSYNRHLFTNIDRISQEFLNKKRILITSRKDLIKLKEFEFKEIENWLYKKKELVKKHEPETYQKEAINNILSELKKSNKATALLACGTGKTNIALWTYEKLKPETAIIFVPSIALIKQIRADWLEQTSLKKIQTLQICSFKETSFREDELKLNTYDVDFEATTDPTVIRNFIRQKNNIPKIIFSTYQSSKVLAKGVKDNIIDFAVFDESHRTARIGSRKNKEVTGFNLALYDKYIKINKRLFLTATRRISNPNKIYNAGDPEITLSMENESLYGKICHSLSFKKAAELGCIAKFKIILSFVTSAEVDKKLRSKSTTLIKNTEIKTDQIAKQIAIQKAVEKYNIKKIFTFHNTVERAKSFCSQNIEGIREHLPEYYTNSIDGKMKLYQREDVMENFKFSKKAILSNARCLVEGVDVPSVEMVAFLDNKNSEIDIVQAAGRALRNRGVKKKFGYVLVPVFVEQNKKEKISEALERTNFENVAQILKAMKEHDSEIAQIINEAVAESKGKGFRDITKKKVQNIIEGNTTIISKDLLLKSIINKSFSVLHTKWDEMIFELKKFKAKNGHLNVRLSNNKSLVRWVDEVRRRIKRNQLFIHQINELKEIGLKFIDPRVTIFNPEKLYTLTQLSKRLGIPEGFLETLSNKKIIKPEGTAKNIKYGRVRAYYKEITLDEIKKLTGLKYFHDSNVYTLLSLAKSTGFNAAQIKKYLLKKKIKPLGKGLAMGGGKKNETGKLVYRKITRRELSKYYGVTEKMPKKYFTLSQLSELVNKKLKCKGSTILLKRLIKYKKIKPIGSMLTNSGRVKIFRNYSIKEIIRIAKPLSFIKNNQITLSTLAKKIGISTNVLTKYAVKTKLLKPIARGLSSGGKKDKMGTISDFYDSKFSKSDFEKNTGITIDLPSNCVLLKNYEKKLGNISHNLMKTIIRKLKLSPKGKVISNAGLSDFYQYIEARTICKKLNYDFLVTPKKNLLTIGGIRKKLTLKHNIRCGDNFIIKKLAKRNIVPFGYGPSNSSNPTAFYDLSKDDFKGFKLK